MTTLTAASPARHLSKIAIRYCIAKAKEASLPCKHGRVLAGMEANVLRETLLIIGQEIPSDALIQEFGDCDQPE